MRLTTKGRYAVTAMLDLAYHSKENPITLTDIATRQTISLSYLEQLFSRLRRAGMVQGPRVLQFTDGEELRILCHHTDPATAGPAVGIAHDPVQDPTRLPIPPYGRIRTEGDLYPFRAGRVQWSAQRSLEGLLPRDPPSRDRIVEDSHGDAQRDREGSHHASEGGASSVWAAVIDPASAAS